MASTLNTLVDIKIDKLTNSIENTISGDVFDTWVLDFAANDKGYKKSNWRFDWKKELENENRSLHKLVIRDNPNIIQGLISITDNHDHVLIHLVENAKFNQGKGKLYAGVAGNLFEFACKKSFDLGYDGWVSFYAKTRLVDHYHQTLGAERLIGDQLVIRSTAASALISQYFKNWSKWEL